jgi:carbonic anhydrase
MPRQERRGVLGCAILAPGQEHGQRLLEALLATDLRHDPDALIRDAVRANVRVSASQLRHGSDLLESLIAREGLLVVGAAYSLESGVVDFFDGVPT